MLSESLLDACVVEFPNMESFCIVERLLLPRLLVLRLSNSQLHVHVAMIRIEEWRMVCPADFDIW